MTWSRSDSIISGTSSVLKHEEERLLANLHLLIMVRPNAICSAIVMMTVLA